MIGPRPQAGAFLLAGVALGDEVASQEQHVGQAANGYGHSQGCQLEDSHRRHAVFQHETIEDQVRGGANQGDGTGAN